MKAFVVLTFLAVVGGALAAGLPEHHKPGNITATHGEGKPTQHFPSGKPGNVKPMPVGPVVGGSAPQYPPSQLPPNYYPATQDRQGRWYYYRYWG